MNENEMVRDDEISLFDLWEKLREGWLVVVGGTVLGIVGAVLAIFLIRDRSTRRWRWCRLGRLGRSGRLHKLVLWGRFHLWRWSRRNRSLSG